jgi:hypothetical protein
LLTKGHKRGPKAKQKALQTPEGLEVNWIVQRLVAGYGFGGFFLLGGLAVGVGMAVTIAVAIDVTIAVAARWGDADRLARVSKIGWDGLGDVAY